MKKNLMENVWNPFTTPFGESQLDLKPLSDRAVNVKTLIKSSSDFLTASC